jgi:hypothetical protein
VAKPAPTRGYLVMSFLLMRDNDDACHDEPRDRYAYKNVDTRL